MLLHSLLCCETDSASSIGYSRVIKLSWAFVQELLDHPFLRPTAAAAPGLVGLTRTQLGKLLAQVSAATAADSTADINMLSEEVFRQLSQGKTVDLTQLLAKPSQGVQISTA